MDVCEYTLTVEVVRRIFVVTKIPWRLINLPLKQKRPYDQLSALNTAESFRFREYPFLGTASIYSPTDLGTVNIKVCYS